MLTEAGVKKTLAAWLLLFPDGIPPDAYPDAIALADMASRVPIPATGETRAPRGASNYEARLPPTPPPAPPGVPAAGEWLTVTEAAELADVSRQAIYYALKTGALHAQETSAGGRRIARVDAEGMRDRVATGRRGAAR